MNEDGMVPGAWTGELEFGDKLEKIVVVDTSGNGIPDTLRAGAFVNGTFLPLDQLGPVSFVNGRSEIELVLYNATTDGISHTVELSFTDTQSGTGTPLTDEVLLVLNPGKIESVNIVSTIVPLEPFNSDTLTLSSNGGTTIRVAGYDLYGNFIGEVSGDWSAHSIPAYPDGENKSQIYYSVGEIVYENFGYIEVQSVDNPLAADTIWILLKPREARLELAQTVDSDGDGYLDAMKLVFDKDISLTDEDLSGITIRHEGIAFRIDSIIGSTDTGSVFTLAIQYPEKTDPIQTSWTPTVQMTGVEEIESMDSPLTSVDGAGPVVWQVLKITDPSGDRTKDKVVVKFSEGIAVSGAGGSLDRIDNAYSKPVQDFLVVWSPSGDSVIPDSTFLKDIYFHNIEAKNAEQVTKVTFYMKTGNDLTARHRVSINGGDGPVVDEFGLNETNENNRAAPVAVIGATGDMLVGPNPMRPAPNMSNKDKLNAKTSYEIEKIVQNYGGMMVRIPHRFSKDSNGNLVEDNLTGVLLVFDAIGNLVYARENKEDMLDDPSIRSLAANADDAQLAFYWNGVTDEGRVVAPGIYRVVVNLVSNGETIRYVENLGVVR